MKRFTILCLVTFLLLTASSASFAGARLGLKGAGAFAGYVKPENLDATLFFGAVVDLGRVAPDLLWEVEGIYWRSGGESPTESNSDLSISTHLKCNFPSPVVPVRPYLGGGVGVHFLRAVRSLTPR